MKKSVNVETTEPPAGLAGMFSATTGSVKAVLVVEATNIETALKDLAEAYATAVAKLEALPDSGSRVARTRPVREQQAEEAREAIANVHAAAAAAGAVSDAGPLTAVLGSIDLDQLPVLPEVSPARPKPRPIRDDPQA